MRHFVTILFILLWSNSAFTQRVQKIKPLSPFSGDFVTDIQASKKDGSRIFFQQDSTGVITLFLPERSKNIYIKLFSLYSGSFDTVIQNIDTTTWVCILNPNCPIEPSAALVDIPSGKAKILTYGGPIPLPLTRNDSLFQKQYKVQIIDYGCLPPCFGCMESYNKVVFQYMDKLYGQKWRDEIVTKLPGL